MSNGTLAKVTAKTAAEICQRFPLGEEAAALLRDGQTPAQFLALLMDKKLHQDAVRFLANALPKREAAWWACQCARSVLSSPTSAAQAALQAAEKWAADPVEDNRRLTMPAAEAAGLGTPAGCAAAASFWSGGSLAPANLPVVPPAEDLTARGVAGAIFLAAVLTEPVKAPERFRQFLTVGIEIANGTQRWKEAPRK